MDISPYDGHSTREMGRMILLLSLVSCYFLTNREQLRVEGVSPHFIFNLYC